MGVDYRIHIIIICNFVIEGNVFTKNLPLSKKCSLWNILREVRQTKLIIACVHLFFFVDGNQSVCRKPWG